MPPAQSDSSSARAPENRPPAAIALRQITKTFPGVVANDRVTLEVRTGEVHALLGENGAGKTTLMNILYGLLQPDAGEIVLHGRPVQIRSPRDAITLGIGMVPQHFLLVRRHSVAENIALGLAGGPFLFPARRAAQQIREVAARYGLAVDPRSAVWQLSVSEQQRIEILKILLRSASILVLDEPTSVLTPQEAGALFGVLRRMKAEGHAVIFISHKLDEVMEVADRVTVLRRGRVVGTLPIAEANTRALARMMVGREVVEVHRMEDAGSTAPKAAGPARDAALSVENAWAQNDRGLDALRGVSLTVRPGEIVGLAGVAGNGQRELVEVLTGLRRLTGGRVRVMGRDVTGRSARDLVDAGIAHVPEERMRVGTVPAMSVRENLVLRHYRRPPFSRGPFLDGQAVTTFARRMIAAYEIATPSAETPVRALSGGNVQKLILARELAGRPVVLVAAHPTSGLDVSATEQIHTLLLQKRREGTAVLLVSEDLEEILALSDRIAVMFRGQIAGIVSAADADSERIGLMMTGQAA